MPCYDPPPPWEGIQQKNALQAARMLCEKIGTMLDNDLIVERNLLLWYAEHREIDLQIATTGYYQTPDPVAAEKAKQDIDRVKRLLAS